MQSQKPVLGYLRLMPMKICEKEFSNILKLCEARYRTKPDIQPSPKNLVLQMCPKELNYIRCSTVLLYSHILRSIYHPR
jgi:hypothetical protein